MPTDDDVPPLVIALIAAPSGWLKVPAGINGELHALVDAGLVEEWKRPDGRYYTLSPIGAERLGVHQVETTGRERRAAAVLGVPRGEDEPAFRWRPRAEPGPRPYQPREHPCVLKPTCLWGNVADYRLEARMRAEGVPTLPPGGEHEVIGIATRDREGRRPAGPGGLGSVPETPARKARLQQLLLEAAKDCRERERASKRKAKARPRRRVQGRR